MKHNLISLAAAVSAAIALSSCSGMLMTSDFGFDDYGPSNSYYWPSYGGFYNPPIGYYGPAWNTPPPPRPYPAPVSPPNGANRPNYIPGNQGNQSSSPVITTTPTGQQRPGNMGQAPATPSQPQTKPAQGGGTSHRGR